MERNADNAGLALLAMVFGVLTAQHWVAQFATSILTVVIGLVTARFVNIALDRWLPRKKQEDDKD